MVTTGTYRKEPVFVGAQRLQGLHDGLLTYAADHGWRLEAWAVLANHYHFVAHSPEDGANGAESLRTLLGHFHSRSAAWVNTLDQCPGRKVWHNFWDTRLTYEKSYLARLHYVHSNAVKHGIVDRANQYRWCSAAWFERTATAAQVQTVYGMPVDRLHVEDDF